MLMREFFCVCVIVMMMRMFILFFFRDRKGVRAAPSSRVLFLWFHEAETRGQGKEEKEGEVRWC